MPELVDVEKQVIAFVAREIGIDSQRISLYSRLTDDFGIAGDDGLELMTNFAKEFGVDLSGFSFVQYFGPEASFVPFALLFPSWWKARRHQRILTVADLVEMAKSGSWRVLSKER